jgi:hypothetical protein
VVHSKVKSDNRNGAKAQRTSSGGDAMENLFAFLCAIAPLRFELVFRF